MAEIFEIDLRRGAAADWTSDNTVLGSGEPGFETDTLSLKVGDGSTAWASLAYVVPAPSGQVRIGVLQTPSSNIRWNHMGPLGADFHVGEISSTGTQFDEITFQKYFQSGTYTLQLLHRTNTTRGIYTVYIDGTSVGTIDGYAASGAATIGSITGITVVGSILHSVRLVMATKNASSSSYVGDISGVVLTRTGA